MPQPDRTSAGPVRQHLREICRLIGERIFAADDEFARRCGWAVIVTHAGLGRAYRDPRIAPLNRVAERDLHERRTQDWQGRRSESAGRTAPRTSYR